MLNFILFIVLFHLPIRFQFPDLFTNIFFKLCVNIVFRFIDFPCDHLLAWITSSTIHISSLDWLARCFYIYLFCSVAVSEGSGFPACPLCHSALNVRWTYMCALKLRDATGQLQAIVCEENAVCQCLMHVYYNYLTLLIITFIIDLLVYNVYFRSGIFFSWNTCLWLQSG